MIAQVAGVNALRDVICCPRCRGPLRIGGTACAACGAACGQEGPILNFVGDGAFIMPGKRDAELVDWLVENHRRFDGSGDFGQFADGERVHLLRRRAGERLLRLGVNWQQTPLLRKLAGHMQYTRPTLERIVDRAGLDIEAFRVLTEYEQLPLLYGLSLRKC